MSGESKNKKNLINQITTTTWKIENQLKELKELIQNTNQNVTAIEQTITNSNNELLKRLTPPIETRDKPWQLQ